MMQQQQHHQSMLTRSFHGNYDGKGLKEKLFDFVQLKGNFSNIYINIFHSEAIQSRRDNVIVSTEG